MSAFVITLFFGWILLMYLAGDTWKQVFDNPKKIPAIGAIASLGALPNLGLFFWFLHKNADAKAKGVLAFVLLLAITLMLIKLL